MSLCPFGARVSTHFPFFSISYRIDADLQGMVTKCAGFRVDAWGEIDGTSKIGKSEEERERRGTISACREELLAFLFEDKVVPAFHC